MVCGVWTDGHAIDTVWLVMSGEDGRKDVYTKTNMGRNVAGSTQTYGIVTWSGAQHAEKFPRHALDGKLFAQVDPYIVSEFVESRGRVTSRGGKHGLQERMGLRIWSCMLRG